MTTNATVRDDIRVYEEQRSDLEARCLGDWVLFYDRTLRGTYATFDEAAKDAVSKFGRGPYLIRQVGAQSVVLPASVMFGPFHASSAVRLQSGAR